MTLLAVSLSHLLSSFESLGRFPSSIGGSILVGSFPPPEFPASTPRDLAPASKVPPAERLTSALIHPPIPAPRLPRPWVGGVRNILVSLWVFPRLNALGNYPVTLGAIW